MAMSTVAPLHQAAARQLEQAKQLNEAEMNALWASLPLGFYPYQVGPDWFINLPRPLKHYTEEPLTASAFYRGHFPCTHLEDSRLTLMQWREFVARGCVPTLVTCVGLEPRQLVATD